MLLYTPPRAARSIPEIDLAGGFSPDQGARRRVAWEIHKACRDTGFFYVSGHRVPRHLIEAQFEWATRFFDLPLDQKMAIHMGRSPATSGYEPIGGQALDSQDPESEKAPPDLKESFYCGMELDNAHPLARAGWRSVGHNLWPASLPGFRAQMLEYWKEMCRLGDRLLSLLALSLDLPERYFEPYYDTPTATLRLIRYPPHPAAAAANQLGAGAHTDWGGITLLAQDDIGGLEVRNVADEWITASPVPDTFVINLGDLVQRWTNDLYRSNMHRVKNLNLAGRNRHSIPFFYGPRPDAMIECLPTCRSSDRPPKYPVVTASEHLLEMFHRSYGYAPAAGR